MPTTVAVKPELIRWAIGRSGLTKDDLGKFSFEKWEKGEKQPTLRQLEAFARQTMTPLGYLFLSAPPEETLPIPDFRTMGDAPVRHPSPNLIETVQTMQRRQAWMRDYLIEQGHLGLPFIGSLKQQPWDVETGAERIRETLELTENWASGCSTWEDALLALRKAAEDAGVLVSASGVVGLSNRRKLDPEEFRGFVLCDDYAPLIFVNSADTKSAQMFTMAHELAHLWLGRGGLFNLVRLQPYDDEGEKYCNRVAAEFLIPRKKLAARWPEVRDAENRYQTIARWFKVSPLVAARRVLDLKLITKTAFFLFYNQQQDEWQQQKAQDKKRKGGDFYRTLYVRLGHRFTHAVVCAAREGRLSYREAYQLTGLNGNTFDEYATRVMTRMRNG